jgi:hypothetical protein
MRDCWALHCGGGAPAMIVPPARLRPSFAIGTAGRAAGEPRRVLSSAPLSPVRLAPPGAAFRGARGESMCPRHCEGNSDKAIEILARAIWIASLARFLRPDLAGVTRFDLSRVYRAPRRPVVLPVERWPKAARERNASFRARAPLLLRPSKVPSRKAPSVSRMSVRNIIGDICQAKVPRSVTRVGERGNRRRKWVWANHAPGA